MARRNMVLRNILHNLKSATVKQKLGLLAGAVTSLAIIAGVGVSLYSAATPPDFAAIEDTQARKTAFVEYLAPAIAELNRERAEERQALEELYAELQEGESAGWWQQRKLEAWAQRYDIEFIPEQEVAVAEKLLLHLDEIPASMVLAQAALESAWGTSRFAKTGDNFFGQWCFTEGCGMVPEARTEGATHEVKTFSSVKEALQGYFRNINSHSVYAQVREIRARARKAGKPLSGLEMVAGLEKYSARGQAYIEELREVIRYNNFE
ncbi:MAG: glucosaminidase domain-containing protein [Gammaproteobacteria bacterium]|nr:glucosaminidase domain-containing protein [Gammaproteobacteria bacterium]